MLDVVKLIFEEEKNLRVSLEGGSVEEVELGVGAGFVLLKELEVGSVWRGQNQASWRGKSW